MEAGPALGLLEHLADLVEDGVRAEDLVRDLAAEEDLLLVLPDGRDVAGPQLQLVLLQDDGGLGVVVVTADELQLHLLHGLPQHDVEELHVVKVGGLHLGVGCTSE